jgi:hypothetical protein
MRWIAASTLLIVLGAGCVSLPFGSQAPELDAEGVDLMLGESFEISQSAFGFGIGDAVTKHVTVEEHQAAKYAVLSWTMDVRRETAASKTARDYALTHVPVGEKATVPEAVFEDVELKGVVRTDALGNAERLLLPSYWPEGEYDVSHQSNSVIWLSKAQYEELVATRVSHIQLGLFDSTLKDALDFTDAAKSALDRLQGKIAATPTSNKDFTKLTAKGDWGTYPMKINGQEVRVKTIEASNAFANYTILANPDNPIILKVSILPWALGPSLFTSLSQLKNDLGYSITSISQPSAN